MEEKFSVIRKAEVRRCDVVNGGDEVTSGDCGDFKCYSADYCMYYHPGHDLPPRCRWGEPCRYKQTC